VWLYASVFFWLFFTGIGIPPLPEEAGIVYAAGLAALHPEVYWWLAWPAAGAGIMAADAVLYGCGRLWGARLFEFRWVKRLMPAERRQRIESRFHQHGIKIVLLARFLPPLRTGIFIIAGAIHFSFLQFVIADLVYAVVGVGALFFGGTWAIQLIHMAGHWLVYPVAAAVGIYALVHYFRYLKKRELKGTVQPPVSILDLPQEAGAAQESSPPRDPSRS